jgi:putative hemolysin
MKTLFMVAITLALAGCAHPPQRPVAEECKAYGFTPGTEGFCYCQMYVANARMSREGSSSLTCKDPAGAAVSCY